MKYLTELMAIIEKAIVAGNFMGGNSLGHGQSFVSDNRQIKRCINQAVKSAKSSPNDIKAVTDLILKAFSFDEKIQQNLVLQVERLIEKEDFSTAKIFSNSVIRAISTKNKNEALFVGLSLPKNAFDDKVYRKLIEICSKLGYYDATKYLIQCLSEKAEIAKKNENILGKMKLVDSRKAIVFSRLALNHLEKSKVNDSLENNHGQIDSISPPFVLPAVFWRYRGLIRGMVSRELRMKYHKSILGWVWAMMEPLALTLTFLLIYEIMATDPAPYRPLSIMIGILFWSFFALTLKRGTVFLESNVRLIQKVSLPKEIFLLSACGFAISTLLLNLLSLIPFLAYYELKPSSEILLLPVVILGIATFGLGLSMITSILHTKLRDTGQIVNVSTRVGFYFTPVFYTIDMIADSRIPAEYVSAYLIANPMAVYLSIARTLIMGTPLGISTDYIFIALVETLVIFIIGSYYYQAKQDQAVKYL